MKTKSGIKIWLHIETMSLVLSWQVYACVELDTGDLGHSQVQASAYQYVGEAIENEIGMTCIFPENYLENFEFIGMY